MATALEQVVRRYGGIDRLITGNPALTVACAPLLELSPQRLIATEFTEKTPGAPHSVSSVNSVAKKG
jgi:hypothetical protein